MKTILVTGAAGFIGSAIAKKLLELNNSVVTVDNLSTGKLENVPEGCVFLKGNVYDEKIIKKLKSYKFDFIIHFAGQSSGEVSFEDPIYDLKTNTQSTLMLLTLSKEIGCENFIYASSMSVYGDQENPFVSELNTTIPKSFYAVGKMASEHYMRIYSQYKIKMTALRLFNVYGKGQNLDNLKQGMASIFLAQALRDKKIFVKGSKDRFRDFVHVDDVVNSVLLAMDRDKGEIFETYNVCTQKKTTVEEIVNIIKENIDYNVSVTYGKGTPGDQNGVYGNNTKIKKDLNWNPTINFKEGMSNIVKFYSKK